MDFAKRLIRTLNQATGSVGPRMLLGNMLKEKATMLDLNIDSKAKTIEAVVQIKGQPAPIKLKVTGYCLDEEGGKEVLRWSSIVIDAGVIELPPGVKDKLEFVL